MSGPEPSEAIQQSGVGRDGDRGWGWYLVTPWGCLQAWGYLNEEIAKSMRDRVAEKLKAA